MMGKSGTLCFVLFIYLAMFISATTGMKPTCPTNMIKGTCTCQRSCADPEGCNSPCDGQCVCPDGFLMNHGNCVPQNECGCFIEATEEGGGLVLQEGGLYIFPNCDRRCSCESGQLDCQNDIQCSPYGSCEQYNNKWNCSCNEGYSGDGVHCTEIVVTDCLDIFNNGQTNSGLYYINPAWSQDPFQVYCNMDDGGGWTVIQRQNGTGIFYRYWADYKNGFGYLDGSMWLGNDKIHNMTSQKDYELRIDLTDRDGHPFNATYSLFRINDESDKYRLLSVGSFTSGDVGHDKLSFNVDNQFSTRDQDNDGGYIDCAEGQQGGWWFGDTFTPHYHLNTSCPTYDYWCEHFPIESGCARCTLSFLNANYNSSTRGRNMFWEELPGYDCRIQNSEMKIRPV